MSERAAPVGKLITDTDCNALQVHVGAKLEGGEVRVLGSLTETELRVEVARLQGKRWKGKRSGGRNNRE